MDRSAKFAIIVGGGIGGLTSALALARQGWTCHVIEAAAEFREVGAGLQLSPNAMKVLRALGLEDAIRAVSFEPEALELRLGRSGREVFRIPAGAAAETRWGAPYLHIHRADLLGVLAEAAQSHPDIGISLGARITHYDHGGDGAIVYTQAGEPLTANLVIGADGLHSTIREQMLGPDSPRYTGNIAWRMVVPVAHLDRPPPPTACVWAGKNRHAVTYFLRRGALVNFVGVVEQAEPMSESWSETGSKAEALADFAGWDSTLTEIINKAETHFRWALYDRPALSRWTDGRATLLGDACHPMLPFQAQGAAMAIEDAWVLAACLDGAASIEDGLSAYQGGRLARTARMQAASRGNMGVFHRSAPLSQLSTYGPMWLAGRMMPGLVRSRLDWIYGHDVTATDR
ncbi:MAG: FAD-dependent monooxygenase [Henriciella sp.]|uniref:FAD-dependent monooxygenase n=1 Tax=Henriciella sp. TaxID=1968823 RepID=UPI003C76C2F2